MNTTLDEIRRQKRDAVGLTLDDLVEEIEDPTWREKHPTGPVHVKVCCLVCGVVLGEDLREFGHLHNPAWVKSAVIPHLLTHQ